MINIIGVSSCMTSISLQNIFQWKLSAIIKLLETTQTSSHFKLPKTLLALCSCSYNDASYHSGGRVEAFFSFQANKLSQNNNM